MNQLAVTADFTTALTAFARSFRLDDAPQAARGRVGDAITDTLGCIVLGARQTLERPLRQALFDGLASGDLAGEFARDTLQRSRRDAQATLSLYLGTLAHAADFDDISHPAYCHATALILPALLVRGAVLGRSGRDIMAAHMVGVEVLGQLGRMIDKDRVPAWHPTSMLGTIGATAALCHLERVSAETIRGALSIAASMACGVRENFGTMTKPLHCGFPGRSAILATSLAQAGLTAAARGIDGTHGMLEVFATIAPWQPKPWGAPLEVMTETGLALKAYPSCAATHPAIDACLALRAELGAEAMARLAAVQVGMSRFAMRPLIHETPATELEAKFCLRYCVATALLDGAVTLDSFSPEAIARPEIAALMARISHRIDPLVADDREFAAIVRVAGPEGTQAERRVDVASGKPGNWLSPAQLDRKFQDCAGAGPRAAALREAAGDLAGAISAQALLAALAGALGEAVAAHA